MLRKSISTTKKLFQKTLKTVKSFLSQDYQKLPKSPPFNPFMEIDKLERRSKKKIPSSPAKNHEKEVFTKMSFGNNYEDQEKKGLACEDYQKLPKSPPFNPFMKIDKLGRRSKKKIPSSPAKNHEKEVFTKMSFGNNYEDQEKKGLACKGKSTKEGFAVKEGRIRSCLVQQKLKELEMVDRSNIEHALDIEDVLYYYSRLTCSAYIDLVDKFLMEIYAEISSSRPKIGSAKR